MPQVEGRAAMLVAESVREGDGAGPFHGLEHPRYLVLDRQRRVPGGEVLRVHDRWRREDVALRRFAHAPAGPAGLDRFRAVAAALSLLDHPHLARVHDLGQAGGTFFYTRELAAGRAPAAVLDPGDEHAFLQGLAGLVDALGALHAAGLAHGLAVPAHLRLASAEGRLAGAMVTDAGVQHLLRPQDIASIRKYLSPEAGRGREATPAGDLYSLGASLLEALGGAAALRRLHRGAGTPFRAAVRGFDRGLLDLLDWLVAHEPGRRPASGMEVLRAMRDPGWALPGRAPSAALLFSPRLVGRDGALGRLGDLLRRAAAGEAHAAEVVGAAGTGKSRLLMAAAARAAAEGWAVVGVEAPAGGDAVGELGRAVEIALGYGSGRAAGRERGGEPAPALAVPGRAPEFPGGDAPPDGTPSYARLAQVVASCIDRAGARLLLVADRADELPVELAEALRYLVTEVGERALLVLAAGRAPMGLPDAAQVEIGALSRRELRQFLAPLLGEALNPEPLVGALARAAGGNPLWTKLLLASWVESERLQWTGGRVYFDERAESSLPPSLVAAIEGLAARLDPVDRDLVEAMAVWGRPLAKGLAARLVPRRLRLPEAFVLEDREGNLRFAADTFGQVILSGIPAGRLRFWHAAVLAALAGEDVAPGTRAIHLLGCGRTGEAARDLVGAARQAAAASAFRSAFEHYRLALAHLHAVPASEIDRAAFALEAARLAIRLGETDWAGGALDTAAAIGARAGAGLDPKLQFEILLGREEVRRERRKIAEAAASCAEARALARAAALGPEAEVRVDLEEVAHDFFAGHLEVGEARVGAVLAALASLPATPAARSLLATALNRKAAFRQALGDRRAAAAGFARAGRLAVRLGDHGRAARAFNNLGITYASLGCFDRALRALDRSVRALAVLPNENLLATERQARANVLMRLGRLDEAEAVLLHARAVRLRTGARARLPLCLGQLGLLLARLGRLEDAAVTLEEAVSIARGCKLRAVHALRGNLGVVRLERGELREAEELIRQGLDDPEPAHRALGLRNLGRVLRRQGRLVEALAALEGCEAQLARLLPERRPLAAIEAARVHLDGGDPGTAALRLEAVAAAAEAADPEVRAEFHLAAGLVEARRDRRAEPPYPAFERAIAAARAAADLPLLAEVLIESTSAALDLADPDGEWLRRRLGEFEEAAARMDAPPVALALRALRGDLAARHPFGGGAAAFAEGLAGDPAARAQAADPSFARALRLMGEAAGALLGAARLAAAPGTGLPAPVPEHPRRAPDAVRPYRVAAREFDRRVLRGALAAAGGSVPVAARLLRLPESTFRYRAWKAGVVGRRGGSSGLVSSDP